MKPSERIYKQYDGSVDELWNTLGNILDEQKERIEALEKRVEISEHNYIHQLPGNFCETCNKHV